MRTKTTSEVPRICVTLDVVLSEVEKRDSRVSNRAIGKALGVADTAVGRWRKGAEPSRDHLLAIERFLGQRPGHISRLAGYVEDDDTHDIPTLIANSDRYTDSGRRVLLRVEADMALMAEEEMAALAQERRRG